jgi:hypothetical protein
MIESMMGDN